MSKVVCIVQPLGVLQNTEFMTDLDEVRFKKLKVNDLGSWRAMGTKQTNFHSIRSQDIRHTSGKPYRSMVGDYFLLTQRYYVNCTYDSFHRTIADIKGECLVLSLLCTFENVVVVVLAENVLS